MTRAKQKMDGAIDELKLKLKSDNGQQSVDLYNREKNMIVGKDSLRRIIKSSLTFLSRERTQKSSIRWRKLENRNGKSNRQVAF